MVQWWRLTKPMPIFALTALLTGCVPGVSSQGGCEVFPGLVTYTPDQQAQMASLLVSLPPDHAARRAFDELGAYRARRRAVCA